LLYVGGYGYNIDNNKNGGWLVTPNSKEANWTTFRLDRLSPRRSLAFRELWQRLLRTRTELSVFSSLSLTALLAGLL
jgi:hypothetical protein